ncbi:deoxyribose-phosphate aldolase [Firmicutes bacterium CAG:449]|nr:deoxyribose-phosphate aldolase [Firmicutes bacterium CAG:449]
MNYNKYIDHTLLKPDCLDKDIEKLCSEAKEYDFASVCVNSSYVKKCVELLKGTTVKVCTVVGFPLGACSTEAKLAETKKALEDGASEIDMVINISRLKCHDDKYVENEISVLKKACGNNVLKVIIETCLLTDEEKIRACLDAVNAHADFVKTSTGFSTGGATVEDVKLMKQTVQDKALVKASGGIKDKDTFLKMIEAGASRIGASKGVEIIKELKK